MSGLELHTFEVLGTTFRVERKYKPLKALGKGAYGVVCAAKVRAALPPLPLPLPSSARAAPSPRPAAAAAGDFSVARGA